MYQFYQIFICLLKFDFFCFVGVTMQVCTTFVNIIRSPMICRQLLIVVLATNSAEFGLTIAAIPVVLSLIAGCAYAVQREIKWCDLYTLLLVSLANISPG